MTRRTFTLAAFCLAAPSAALAAGTAETIGIPWGEWLTTALSGASAVLVPLAAAAVTAGVARVAPWAGAVLTRERIEAAIRAGADYGQNAVAGAVRGRTVGVAVGPAVVAAGTRHVLANAPAAVVRRAGGPEGVATRIFRALPLDAEGSAETVLAPALRLLRADPPRRA
ncbi:hypothetical protein [Methylobacterium sp. J-076]|uniref:hypothetical protein n=1 Tax=Methylobacterium sp. J-076 TaxID=2836655 RepID=UPI001FB89D1A|nr:hypothetical protein [Methylobacterium sp. J-076]MCJ2011216.1 hypothetical protein [Methylobacterium sp. J-076]